MDDDEEIQIEIITFDNNNEQCDSSFGLPPRTPCGAHLLHNVTKDVITDGPTDNPAEKQFKKNLNACRKKTAEIWNLQARGNAPDTIREICGTN